MELTDWHSTTQPQYTIAHLCQSEKIFYGLKIVIDVDTSFFCVCKDIIQVGNLGYIM